MVRYPVSRDALDHLIEDLKPGWLAGARTRTAAIVERGHYDKAADGDAWRDIKTVYMTLQANKCAYCERKLAGPPYGNREHDVEHFRPKSRVRVWPNATLHRHLADPETGQMKEYGAPLGAGNDAAGYALLAFHPLNYCTACARCNQALKSDFFPVGGTRNFTQRDPARMKREKAYLIYPLADIDEDPRSLITFAGVLPVPVAARGHARRRAEITIDFFALASEDLAEERAGIISALYFPLLARARGERDPEYTDAVAVLDLATSPRAPHASCSWAFQQTFESQPDLARQYFEASRELLARLRA